MTNYEKICAIINAGHIAQVEHEDGRCMLFSSIMKEGDTRCTYIEDTIEECFESLGYLSYTKNDIGKLGIKSISIYKKPLWYPEEGELVMILDTIKDEPDYEDVSDSYKEMIGGPFRVKYLTSFCCGVFNKSQSDYQDIDYRHLVPYLGEENKTDDLSKGKEMIFTVNGKEYKAIIQ